MCLSVPAQVVSVSEDCYGSWAIVDMGGVRIRVSAELAENLVPKKHVLVHAGFILGEVDEEEAKATLCQIQIDAEVEKTLRGADDLLMVS